MLNSQQLSEVLRANGYKVTPQRLAVYEALAATKSHPTAEMLFSVLQPNYPSMSFATVYKTVEILHKINVIQILNTGEDSMRYDADTSIHHHIQCISCGRVDDLNDLDSLALVQLRRQSARTYRHLTLKAIPLKTKTDFHMKKNTQNSKSKN